MNHKILTVLFHVLLLITPLFWLPVTSELFEFNKMMLVYLLTTLITTLWAFKMVEAKSLLIKRTPLDIPILIFLASQILSTIFSIDTHLSIFGYYSRQNGGLLSTLAYILLFYAFVSNFSKDETLKFLKTAVIGGVVVSLWAIPEHFGYSPSCLIINGTLGANCWVQDVQARVFATLGQPNWLASYLGMLIFPCIYFVLTAPNKLLAFRFSLFAILIYTAFTFTYSRGATLGLLVGLVVFLSIWFIQNLQSKRKLLSPKLITSYLLIAAFLSINLIFGSALTSFKLFDKFSAPVRESITTSVTNNSVGTQLENGGTESGTIRLIVWRGAIDIFKHYPFFGSGVETFAYSYYMFRPVEHNLVSEWDFLYNKAHNEYLNYLATTGALGFISYLAVILLFIVWSLKQIMSSEFRVRNSELYILHSALLSSYISYLISNFFGFSVVITALLFFLIPAFALTLSPESLKPIPTKFALSIRRRIRDFIFATVVETTITKAILILIPAILLYNLFSFWKADNLYAKASKQLDTGDVGSAYNTLIGANSLNPYEPLYLSELAFTAANSAVALDPEGATTSAQMKEVAVETTEGLLKDHPHNTSLFRSAIRTYFTLSLIDPSFTQKTLEVIDQSINLAPTDPKIYYNKALVLDSVGKVQEAKESVNKALELKPNYQEAKDLQKELE